HQPLVSLDSNEHAEVRVSEVEQDLEDPAEHVLPRARRGRRLRHYGRGRLARGGRDIRQRRCQASDRRLPANVLHGYRPEVPSLPDLRAEVGQHQGVSAQFIKEVALDGQAIDAQDVGQDFGESALGTRRRVGAPVRTHRTLRGADLGPVSKCLFHTSSAQKLGKNELITVSNPCSRARSLTSLATARSSTPSPNGLNTETASDPFLAEVRPLRMSAKVQRMNFL